MGQYIPLYAPGSTGAIIDPEMINYELQRVARAHNAHSPIDFSASCITSAALVDPNNYFTLALGIKGSWNLGAVTLSTRLVSMGAPVTGMVLCGGYVTAEDLNATTTYKLYYNGNAVESVSVPDASPGTATALSTLAATPVTMTAGQILDIRASGTLTAKNLIFWIKAYCPHTS